MDLLLLGWPDVGLGIAPLLVVWLVLERRPGAPPRWQDPAWVLPLLWPIYLVHQFEEHGIDLLGRRYAFQEGLCGVLGHAESLSVCPATPAFLFAVNAVGCQMTFAFSLVFRRRRPLVAACAWGVALVNGVIHVGSSLAHGGAYNPGVGTSLLLFLPLSAWMLRTVVRAGVVERREVPRIIATGVLAHAVLLASLFLRERGWLSPGALLAVNATNGVWPLVFGLRGAQRTTPVPAA